jgi:hypothetical protein
MRRAPHERVAHDDGFASDSSIDGHKKKFWTTPRNRVVGDLIAMRIARIGRRPIRAQAVSRDREQDRSARKCVPKRPQHDRCADGASIPHPARHASA